MLIIIINAEDREEAGRQAVESLITNPQEHLREGRCKTETPHNILRLKPAGTGDEPSANPIQCLIGDFSRGGGGWNGMLKNAKWGS